MKNSKQISCKKITRDIPAYLNKKLPPDMEEDFIDHVSNCPDCMEELTISLLVHVGLDRLEEINSFNVKKELELLLNQSRKKIHRRKILYRTTWILLGGLAVAAVGGTAVWVLLF